MAELKIVNPQPGVWVFDDGGINLYLIAGTQRAVLLDSGFGFHESLRSRAESLCGLPVTLVHTHAHGDHTGGDGEWSEAYLHPAEWESYRNDHPNGAALLPLQDGDVLDLGGRSLEAVHVPGHSPGSVALLDRANRLLFSGDTVMAQPVFLFMPSSSAADFAKSLARLDAMSDQFDTIYPSHQRWPLDPKEAIPALRDCAQRALDGDETTQSTFEIDLVVAVAQFSGYVHGDYAVAMRDLKGEVPGVPQSE
jgi:glyoxylase-like metal-dependent hydrolase (beta-lactamase superfamily II)